jgi:hypothetical protein
MMKVSNFRKASFFSAFSENFLFLALMALLTGLTLLQTNPATNYPSRDGGVFAYVGSEIMHGKLLYVDVWDHKPPGIHYLNALALFLGQGSRWGIWLLEFIFLFLSVLLSHALLSRLWGKIAALFGTLLWLCGLAFTLYNGNYTEEYSLLFNFLALFLFLLSLRKPSVLQFSFFIGITGGLSFLFRPNNIGVQLTIGSTILLMGFLRANIRQAIKQLCLLATGVLLPFIIVAIFFAWQKALPAMLNAVFTYNFSYSSSTNLFTTLGSGFIWLNVIALIALAGYIGLIRNVVRQGKAALDEWNCILLLGWPVEILLSSLSGRAYNHYFICWLPMMALLGAYTFSSFGKRAERVLISRPLWLTYIILFVILLAVSWHGLTIYKDALTDVLTGKRPTEAIDPVSKYLLDHTHKNDTVLVWGAQAGINLMSGREAPTAYFLYPMFVPSRMSTVLEDRFFADLESHPPTFIVDVYYLVGGNLIGGSEFCFSLDSAVRVKQLSMVDESRIVVTPHNIEQVYKFVEKNYHLETQVGKASIYRLNP